jgi:hypothetical protein
MPEKQNPPEETPEPVPESENDPCDSTPPERHSVTVERVLELLNCGEIDESYGRLRWSSNYTTIVSVKDEALESLAVYKPRRGERPLWDFPDGTLCNREVAAFLISDALGWDIVPPTILREGPSGVGSLQLFIEHDSEVNYFSLSDDFLPELQLMTAFDALVNNADRKGGHCLVDPQAKLWGIDHGICFHSSHKLRTVIWDFAGDPIPDTMLDNIQGVLDQLCNTESNLHKKIKQQLGEFEIEALLKRAKRLLQRKTFPQPGPGPNYPWPPV